MVTVYVHARLTTLARHLPAALSVLSVQNARKIKPVLKRNAKIHAKIPAVSTLGAKLLHTILFVLVVPDTREIHSLSALK